MLFLQVTLGTGCLWLAWHRQRATPIAADLTAGLSVWWLFLSPVGIFLFLYWLLRVRSLEARLVSESV
jgi:hypothetical protein